MARDLIPIDIADTPDLLSIAEEVRRSGRPRLLRRADEDIAVLSPVPPRAPRGTRRYTKADDDAFPASAGGWKDFDLEEFLRHNEESRRVARPPVEL